MNADRTLETLLAALNATSPSLTLFDLRDGVALAGPDTDGTAALIVLDGTMLLDAAGERQAVATGRLVLLPPREILIGCGGEADGVVASELNLARRGGWPIVDATRGAATCLSVAAARIVGTEATLLRAPMVLNLAATRTGGALLRMLREQCRARGEGGAPLATALMHACVVEALNVAGAARREQSSDVAHGSGTVARAIAAIRARPGAAHTIDALADLAGMSRASFDRHFRRSTRMAPQAYVQHVRLEEARTLLAATALPVKAIAARVGFASRTHFARAFRVQFGVEPSRYRSEAQCRESRDGIHARQ